MAGIYIHIPFCKQACHYCDFHFSTSHKYKNEIVQAISMELEMQKDYLNEDTVDTIYLGGGTPSLLTSEELEQLLATIKTHFSVSTTAEITLEANPDDMSPEMLSASYALGVNRLSIGIQSFDDQILKFLHRAHTREGALTAIQYARNAGFKNISIDLIYGIPGQAIEGWTHDIKKAISLDPEHISSYSLTIEEGTVFGTWSRQGKLKLIEDDEIATQLETLMFMLEEAGYHQYEVSNFGKPGFYAHHNSSYWKQKKNLGVGPSAHSFNGFSRQFNVRNNAVYQRSIQAGKIPFTLEILSREDRINEYLLTSLRTSWGCDVNKLKDDYDFDLFAVYPEYIEDLLKRNLAHLDRSFLKLTKPGKLLADKISSDLFVVTT